LSYDTTGIVRVSKLPVVKTIVNKLSINFKPNNVIALNVYASYDAGNGSSINDVTQFWGKINPLSFFNTYLYPIKHDCTNVYPPPPAVCSVQSKETCSAYLN